MEQLMISVTHFWIIMRDFFRRASFLFWQFPVLWLPVMAADLIVFLIRTSEKAVAAAIVRVFEYHSVLGGRSEPIAPYSSQVWKIGLLTFPIFWIAQLCCIALFCVALIQTNALQQAKVGHIHSRSWVWGTFSETGLRQLAIFVLKVFGMVVAGAILFVRFSFIFSRYPTWLPVSVGDLGYIYGIAMMMLIAYLVAPMSISLLRGSREWQLPKASARCGQMFAVFAMFASGVLGWIVPRVESTFLVRTTSYLGVFLIQAAGSMAAAFPYILLFIVISLLANQADHGTSISDAEVISVEETETPAEE